MEPLVMRLSLQKRCVDTFRPTNDNATLACLIIVPSYSRMIFLCFIIALASESFGSEMTKIHSMQKRSHYEPWSYYGINIVDYFGVETGPGPAELRAHPEETEELDIGPKEKLVEGDMIITNEQDEWTHESPLLRKARDDSKYLWPRGRVPYAIDPTSEGDEAIIKRAIRSWEENTCLTFPKIPHKSKGPHIFFAKKDGCSSHVGRVAEEHPNGQQVSLGTGCGTFGITVHEIGHAIGFYHEQSRPDRDDHIIIVEDNIIEERKSNFLLRTNINDENLPYDLKSIMHYGPRAFTKNGENTIVTRDPSKQFQIGQRNGLSFYDIKLANLLYKCNSQCSVRIRCYNEGFVDKNCRCRCPPEYWGSRCENYEGPAERQCGYTITRTQTLTTPDWPSNYPENSRCIWRIIAPNWMKVRMTFDEFDLRSRNKNDTVCRSDYVEVRTDDRYHGKMYCGSDLKGKTLTSRRNEVWVLFHSRHKDNKGFRANIRFVGNNYYSY